jgi:hypothetical protein
MTAQFALNAGMGDLRFGAIAAADRGLPSTSRPVFEKNATHEDVARGFKTTISSRQDLGAQLFDRAVNLKVTYSTYSMHLSDDERRRTFDEIDYLLDESGWDPEDILPRSEYFVEFLRWAVYSRNFDWVSLGVGDKGEILAAWQREGKQLTAAFGKGEVSWTFQGPGEDGLQVAAGKCSPLDFARYSAFYLQRAP